MAAILHILDAMPHTEKHAPGSFAWTELATTDQAAAKAFYSALFNWAPDDRPMGPDPIYTIFRLDGQAAAAAYSLTPAEQAIRPHWNLYVNVENADKTVERARELGGTIMEGPFDVGEFGRMAVLRDPTGAYFNIWQPNVHVGFGVRDQPGSFCWADLNTPDASKAASFYSALFGWTMAPGESGYLHIQNREVMMGGIPPAALRNPDTPPHWLVYFHVADCAASTSKAAEFGATILTGPVPVQTVGNLSVIADPQGAVSALFELK